MAVSTKLASARAFLYSALILAPYFLTSDTLFAQPSLDPVDAQTIVVNSAGGTNSFTVYCDGQDEYRTSQFYYTPNRVRLTERIINGKAVPEFTLVKYGFGDETQETVTGGILQFLAVTSATDEEILQLKEKIITEYKLPPGTAIRIAPLQLKKATVTAYTPAGSLISSSYGSGTAPNDATQKMVFQVDLTNAGVNVYKALTEAQGGIPVVVTMDYWALTPKAKAHIEYDYRQIATHYSSDKKVKSAAAASGFYGAARASATATSDMSKVREALENSGGLKIKLKGNTEYTSKDLNTMIAPILARINEEILLIQKPPEKIDPAVAKEPDATASSSDKMWSVAYARGESSVVKDIEQIKNVHETIDIEAQDIVTLSSSVSGLIGIGAYPKEIRDQLYVRAYDQTFPTWQHAVDNDALFSRGSRSSTVWRCQ